MSEREIPTIHPDTGTLKAMSHPVRLRMLGMLRTDGPATASQLAAQLGLNSGATSYHLRQLADYGLVEEDAGRGNKRDRWWRAAHESTRTNLSEENDPDARAATIAFWQTAVGEQVRAIESASQELQELPREWADASTNSDWSLRLTPAQMHDLVDRIAELLDAARQAEPGEGAAPDGADLVTIQLHAFPKPGRVAHREEP